MWLYGQEVIKISYHPAKFGGHRHSGSGDAMCLVCQVIFMYDVTSTCLIILIWVKSCRCIWLPNLVIIGLIEIEKSILIPILTWIRWKKLNSPSRSAILRYFEKQEYQFTIPKSQTGLAEKREEVEEKEYRQLQSVMRLTQNQ